jgi:hypothetical protein
MEVVKKWTGQGQEAKPMQAERAIRGNGYGTVAFKTNIVLATIVSFVLLGIGGRVFYDALQMEKLAANFEGAEKISSDHRDDADKDLVRLKIDIRREIDLFRKELVRNEQYRNTMWYRVLRLEDNAGIVGTSTDYEPTSQ